MLKTDLIQFYKRRKKANHIFYMFLNAWYKAWNKVYQDK